MGKHLFALFAVVFPTTAAAHSFGVKYTLPVPVEMYMYSAAAALALSFLVAALFMRQPAQESQAIKEIDLANIWFSKVLTKPMLMWAAKIFTVFLLALAIFAGYYGTQNQYNNINMTLFWIVFVLGFAYFTAVIGNLYAAINPWRVISELLALVIKPFRQGIFRYPAHKLGYSPALALYMAFIWVELFAYTKPHSLSNYLLGYTVINLAGALLFGIKSWFRYGELFSVFLRLIALMAPIYYQRPEDGQTGQWKLTLPFANLMREVAESWTLLLFILFMLSSTAFDGLHETQTWYWGAWAKFYLWTHPESIAVSLEQAFALCDAIVEHGAQKVLLMGRLPPEFTAVIQTVYSQHELRAWFNYITLFLSPFLYLAIYIAFVWLSKLFARSALSLKQLCFEFAFPLLPIVLVYHVTHYYTLIQTQGIKIFQMMSDPFGKRWDLFGTADWFRYSIIPDVGTVWHVQVIMIVIGHIIGVYYAHKVALKVFPTTKAATLSQIPMLILMMIFTAVGLWILAQPLQQGG